MSEDIVTAATATVATTEPDVPNVSTEFVPPAASADAPSASSSAHWIAYLVKSAVLIGLLYLFARRAGMLSPLVIALVWAALSAVSAVGITYHRVVRKTLKQHEYAEKGLLSRLNNGRTVCLVVSFVASAWCMAGLILEAPTWGVAEWVLVVTAIPLYLGVFLLAQRFLSHEYKPVYRASKATLLSCTVMAVLLTGAYAGIGQLQPAQTFTSASEAFLSVDQPFAGSPSALASEAGTISALIDGFAAYGTSRAAETSEVGYAICRGVLVFSVFCGVASLLGLCSLGGSELKRVFLPLDAGVSPDAAPAKVVKRNVVVAIVLPVVLVGLYLAADSMVAKASQTQEYTAAQRFVRDQVDLAVYVLDGSYYEYQSVQEALNQAKLDAAALAQEAQETLVPLINASYDARIANVDAYLDWYYSLPADYERLLSLITGSVEEFVQDQFVAQIEAGVDDTAFEVQLRAYWDRAEALKDGLMEQIAACEIAGIPEWLPVVKDEVTIDALLESLEPSERFASAGERLLTSAGAGAAVGVGTGIAAKKLVSKAAEKPFFKMIVSEITKRLGSRAVGSAVGGAVGTLGGPAGVAVGVLAGGAAGVGVDYGLLKLDEFWNRETYRDEVVQTIEDARAEMLAVVQGA